MDTALGGYSNRVIIDFLGEATAAERARVAGSAESGADGAREGIR